MGLSFTSNGKYIGWSNLFDYSSIEALQASESIPMPSKTKLINYTNATKSKFKENIENGINPQYYKELLDRIESNDIIDLDKHSTLLDEINRRIKELDSEDRELANKLKIERIKIYISAIKEVEKVKKDGIAIVRFTSPSIFNRLQSHYNTSLPISQTSEISKNFISSHIQSTISHPSNLIGAYTPVEMVDYRDAASDSPKANQQTSMTTFNPSTILFMQYANMTGKNVVGIAANGMKASFMWHYYINDIIKAHQDKVEYAKFNLTFNRIKGRFNKNISSINLTGLPDLNMLGVPENIQAIFSNRLFPDIMPDDSHSQFMSAATDNAKELILAKINAGSKLAKIYLYLGTLGFDVKDMVAFMTSDVISFIDKITEPNIFEGKYNISLETAIDIAKGLDQKKRNHLVNIVGELKTQQIEHLAKKMGIYIEIDDTTLKKVTEGDTKGLNQSTIDLANKKLSILEDLEEFSKVLEGANEFSNFGKLLGLNQGLPTNSSDSLKLLSTIKSYFDDRLELTDSKVQNEITKSLGGDFDPEKWVHSIEYRKTVSECYNKIKSAINIFEIVSHIPQYAAILDIYSGILYSINNIAIKSKIANMLEEELRKLQGYEYIPESYRQALLQQVDNALVYNFIKSQNIQIPLKASDKIIKEDGSFKDVGQSTHMILDSMSSIATFKYWMEEVLVPNLIHNGGQDYINIDDYSQIKNNLFITSLRAKYDKEVKKLGLPLNMLTIKDSPESQMKFSEYQLAFEKLDSIKIGNSTLKNLFMLYELIINKDRYGSDKMNTLFGRYLKDSLLSEFHQYVSKLDYYSNPSIEATQENSIAVNIKDMLISAAPIVSGTAQRNEPYVILKTPQGPKYYRKDSKGYTLDHDFLQRKPIESESDYLSRQQNVQQYFVLGGVFFNEIVNLTSPLLSKDNNQIIKTLNILQQRGYITITKSCK